MSIASEISRINNNIAAAYTELSQMDAKLPEVRNSANLSRTIDSVPRSSGTVTVRGKNLLDPSAITANKSMNWSTGAISDHSTRCISDYIPVTAGMYLVSSYYVRKVLKKYTLIAVCFYDENKSFLSGAGDVSGITVPEGAVYARVCGNSYMPQESYKVQIELSNTPYPTFFEPYREASQGLPDSVISANGIITSNNRNRSFCLALPRKLYCTTNETVRVYHRNILSHPKYIITFYTADVMDQGETVNVTVKNYDDYAEFSTTGSGAVYIPYAVYDDNFNLIAYDNIEMYVTADSAHSASVLLIGDSTVAQDNLLETKLQDLYAGSAAALTLLGTRGAAGKKHEGRAGWKAEDYVNISGRDDVTNAFWDGSAFNFSYYMTQQSYSSVDAVFIQLGVNDLISKSPEEANAADIIGYIDEMVSSIKSYSNSAKIVVNTLIPPNSDGTTFAETYRGIQSEWLYRYNTIKFNQLLIDYYRGDSRLTVLGTNAGLDTNTDIRDGVHPASSGHGKIARSIYDYLTNETER